MFVMNNHTAKITFLKNIFKPSDFETIPLSRALNEIRLGTYRDQINQIRTIKQLDPTLYKEEKGKLPAWAFSGSFSGSVNNSGFVESSGLMTIDIDTGDIFKAREILKMLPFTYAVFTSPSGEGLKVLIRINADHVKNDDDNKHLFNEVKAYIESFGIVVDGSGCDVRRVCFVSYDPDIWINETASIIPVTPRKAQPVVNVPAPAMLSIATHNQAIVDRLVYMLKHVPAGSIHKQGRVKLSLAMGGYIAGGQVDNEIGRAAMLQASHDINDFYNDGPQVRATAHNTVKSFIDKGLNKPIFSLFTGEIVLPDSEYYTHGSVAPAPPMPTSITAPPPPPHLVKKLAGNIAELLPEDHILRKMTDIISYETWLPSNTVFMVGAAIVGSMLTRSYKVAYKNGYTIPTGLYVIAEQPPATSKTWCVREWQAPFFKIADAIKNSLMSEQDYFKQLKDLDTVFTDEQRQSIASIDKRLSILKSLFITNATPEAMENSLTASDGFFSAVSSEQGLFNSLLGGSYGKDRVNNNDILLNGFDGGRVASMRLNRAGYFGQVLGGVCCFAQDGSVKTVLDASGGTGLSERFIMLAEPNNLGTRDHNRVNDAYEQNQAIKNNYSVLCRFFNDYLNNPETFDNIKTLKISAAGWRLIADYKNEIEPKIADGGIYSHINLRGAAGKSDIQIMKISSILHAMSEPGNLLINDSYVSIAIKIVDLLIQSNLSLCEDKEIIGKTSEENAVIGIFERDNRPKHELTLVQMLTKNKPFKDLTANKSKHIREVLTNMVFAGIIKLQIDPTGKRFYNL